MADLDGDHLPDLLSGSWAGEIFFFKRNPDQTFAATVKLKDKDGRTINIGGGMRLDNDNRIEIIGNASFESSEDGGTVIVYEGERIPLAEGEGIGVGGTVSAVHAADFNGDGTLDLLVGDGRGDVYLVANVGTAMEPAFATERRVRADRKPLRVNGDAAPFVCDWDGDGAIDLLVGDGQGAVWYYRNENTNDAPELAAGVVLVPPRDVRFDREAVDKPRRGTSARICAFDWDGDGRLDLLVGDSTDGRTARSETTPEEKAEQDAAREEMEIVGKRLGEIIQTLRDEQHVPDGNQRKELEEESRAASEEIRDLSMKIPQELEKHGRVWLFQRKPAEVQAVAK